MLHLACGNGESPRPFVSSNIVLGSAVIVSTETDYMAYRDGGSPRPFASSTIILGSAVI